MYPFPSPLSFLSTQATIESSTQTPLEGFGIMYNVVGESDVTNIAQMNPAAAGQLLTGLMKGTEYSVTVLAVNSAGDSGSSDPMVQRTDVDRKLYMQCVSWSFYFLRY